MSIKLKKINKILVANRSEIAIRIMRAATELDISTVAIYSQEDRFALHRYKADESYLVGDGKGPIEAYLDISDIIRIAIDADVDAIHPGYGFLSENPEFADQVIQSGMIFIGPTGETMRQLGSKVAARRLAVEAGVPVMPATEPLPSITEEKDQILKLAEKIGYPLMCKATWGGGGRGMRIIEKPDELLILAEQASREAAAAFGNGEIYLEKLVKNARHIEVQVMGDLYGNIVHMFERDCSLQRRHQKVVERAPAIFLDDKSRDFLCEQGLKIARAAKYQCAGTVEFLQDADNGEIYFIEVNPRIQVEHTVTDWVTGIDLVQAQMRIAAGGKIGDIKSSGVPSQKNIRLSGHAIQCRVTTEDPENNFTPDYGRLTAYRSASGFGIRLDAGTAFAGALITSHFDSLLVKVTSWAPDAESAMKRMDRALREFRIRGVTTNLRFLENLINHQKFLPADYTTSFIDKTKELFEFPERRDRASRLLNFIGNVIVNGNDEVKGHKLQTYSITPHTRKFAKKEPKDGTKQLLEKLGPEKFSNWMLDQKRVLVTDTTMRDAHQSILATRVRTQDLLNIAPSYTHCVPNMFSMECWGGATFDVAMRFLNECPWERLKALRGAMPNILTQMLLRSANGVGYNNYPDNVIKFFIRQCADTGMDLFRVFDALNWVENMRTTIDAVRDNGKLCEGAICYTGDITDPEKTKYDLNYYVRVAKELKTAGVHILGIKDMAGICKPNAAKILVKALKEETGLPIHFHTHDTSGIASASVLAAIESGADAVDAAIDSMSGLTSQPNLGAIVEALKNTERETCLDTKALADISTYWEHVRALYSNFESEFRSGASEVYSHEIPGGQYTNLRQQARSLGINEKWPQVAKTYAQVNQMFGDIIKVTPTSKVVGDLTLFMITSNISKEQILDPNTEIAFPESVIQLFRGELGQPYGGFPEALQKKILNGNKALTVRPGSILDDIDLKQSKEEVEKIVNRSISDQEHASYLMYPKVFCDYSTHMEEFGDVSKIPTKAYFYGMDVGDEIAIEMERGKTLALRLLAVGDPATNGQRTIFFELNGQPRSVRIHDRNQVENSQMNSVAEKSNPNHVGAPMPGIVSNIHVNAGGKVKKGDQLLSIEAMKMETAIKSERDGIIKELLVTVQSQVRGGDLLIIFED